MKKTKLITATLLAISIIATSTSLYLANELKIERAINQEQTERFVNLYQLTFANGTDNIKSNGVSEETVSSLLDGLESSMVYYNNINITEDEHRTAYLAVTFTYMKELLAYLDGQAEDCDIDTIVSDLIIIGDWLRERNTNEIVVAHNDDDFYEVYLKLSSDLVDVHEKYFE